MSATTHRQPIDPSGCPSAAPRYPEVHVCLHSGNPLALVSAVRYALRRAGVEPSQISRFSIEALGPHSDEKARRVCQAWVDLHAPVH